MSDPVRLRETLLSGDVPAFAVMDGAYFDDLPNDLFDGDFVHRPLYRDNSIGNRDQARTAPQLVWLNRDRSTPETDAGNKVNPSVLDQLIKLLGNESSGAVFWQCLLGGDVLFRHLRTINMVMVPRDIEMDRGKSYEADPRPNADANKGLDEDPTHMLVLFRHADANVMAQVLPALDGIKFARLFGPANQIVFTPDKEWGSPIMIAPKPDGLPRPPAGPLRLDSETIRNIEASRLMASRRRRVSYLQETCGQEIEGAPPDAIAEHVRVSEETGNKIGLVSEAAHCRWAYLMFATQGKVARSPELGEYIKNGGSSPDDQMRLVMKSSITALKQQRSQMERS